MIALLTTIFMLCVIAAAIGSICSCIMKEIRASSVKRLRQRGLSYAKIGAHWGRSAGWARYWCQK